MFTIPMMRRIRHVHFVGIGGSGMSGIAEVLLNQGYQVTGSDRQKSLITERLVNLGAQINYTHNAANVNEADVVITSSAIGADNPEVMAATQLHIPIIPRAQMLAELMRFRYGIAIAGTHGKTTTTSLVATILSEAKLDPTFVVGGILNSANSNARLGRGPYFVIEADESDSSFLRFNPMAAIITNVDADHMGTYGNSLEKLKQAFLEFIHRLPFYGLAVICIDDPVVRELYPYIARPCITYGFSDDANVRVVDFVQEGLRSSFKIIYPGEKIAPQEVELELNLAGKHNALNATAAFIIARECCGVSETTIAAACSKFQGVGRRMQSYGQINLSSNRNITVIDDYGHHPREIAVTLEALRAAFPGRRVVLAFQPHRYTRTQALFEEFVQVLAKVDLLLLMQIYAASEAPIEGVNSESLIGRIAALASCQPIYVADSSALVALLPEVLRDGDILLLQGAGSIGTAASTVAERYGVTTSTF